MVAAGTNSLTNVAPGSAGFIRAVVTVKATATVGTTKSWLVVGTSTGWSSGKDAVKAKVKVSA